MTELRLYDNTRLTDYKRCPRLFFFRHVLHWVSTGERRVPLVFGSAWHEAMDSMWASTNRRDPKNMTLDLAYDAWVTCWTDEGMPHPSEMDLSTVEELTPRTPGIARDMLDGYYVKRHRMMMESEIIEIERPFAVPLDPGDPSLFYVGRIDKVLRVDAHSVRGIEHKTTTSMRLQDKKQRVSPMFKQSFSPNSQVDGYLYTLKLLYPQDRCDVLVDAALVHKLGEDYEFIPCERQTQQLDMWMWEAFYWIGQIETQKVQLQQASEADRYLGAFPKNTNSCFDFNTQCNYLDLCKARSNPLTWGPEAPPGYKVQKWDPLDHIGTPKELL